MSLSHNNQHLGKSLAMKVREDDTSTAMRFQPSSKHPSLTCAEPPHGRTLSSRASMATSPAPVNPPALRPRTVSSIHGFSSLVPNPLSIPPFAWKLRYQHYEQWLWDAFSERGIHAHPWFAWMFSQCLREEMHMRVTAWRHGKGYQGEGMGVGRESLEGCCGGDASGQSRIFGGT